MSSRHTQPRSKLFKTVSSSILGHMNAVKSRFSKKDRNRIFMQIWQKARKKGQIISQIC